MGAIDQRRSKHIICNFHCSLSRGKVKPIIKESSDCADGGFSYYCCTWLVPKLSVECITYDCLCIWIFSFLYHRCLNCSCCGTVCCSYSLGFILDTWVTPHNGSAGVCRQQMLLIKCLCSVSSSLMFMLPKCGKKACAFQNNKNQIVKIFWPSFIRLLYWGIVLICHIWILTWILIYAVLKVVQLQFWWHFVILTILSCLCTRYQVCQV